MTARSSLLVRARLARVLLAFLVTTSLGAGAHAVDLTTGDVPPPLGLPGLDGAPVTLAELAGRPVVLMFGELYHPRTQQACEDVDRAILDRHLVDEDVARLLVVSQDVSPEALRGVADEAGITSIVLRDPGRTAFGAYGIRVLPTTVILGPDGRVVHAMTGSSALFRDTLTDALLVAIGRLSRATFERNRTAASEPDEALLRAERITALARQLARRNLLDLAALRYAEALEVRPQHVPALLGRAALELRRGHLGRAEEGYRAVLAVDARLAEATIGLAYVQTLRGGNELADAERALRDVLASAPSEASAHYVLGLVHEQRNDAEAAAASFRTAAELLMSNRDARALTPTEIGP